MVVSSDPVKDIKAVSGHQATEYWSEGQGDDLATRLSSGKATVHASSTYSHLLWFVLHEQLGARNFAFFAESEIFHLTNC